jgi:hypothetical protein
MNVETYLMERPENGEDEYEDLFRVFDEDEHNDFNEPVRNVLLITSSLPDIILAIRNGELVLSFTDRSGVHRDYVLHDYSEGGDDQDQTPGD